jgi:hypothetical protein
MEQGLNDGGFLVCKFIFRVSSGDFLILRPLNSSSDCQGSLPCRNTTKERPMKVIITLMMNDNITRKVEDAFGLGCPTLRLCSWSRCYVMCRFALLSACSDIRYKYLNIIVYKLFNTPVDMRWVGVSGPHIATIHYNAKVKIAHLPFESQRVFMTGPRLLLSMPFQSPRVIVYPYSEHGRSKPCNVGCISYRCKSEPRQSHAGGETS